MLKQFILAFLLSTLLLGCLANHSGKTTGKQLKPSGTWLLHEINGETFNVSEVNFKVPTVVISDTSDMLRGNNGCNSYGGIVKFKGDSADFKIQFSTKMFCLESIDRAFDSTLQVTKKWYIKDDRLYLLSGGKPNLIFTKTIKE